MSDSHGYASNKLISSVIRPRTCQIKIWFSKTLGEFNLRENYMRHIVMCTAE